MDRESEDRREEIKMEREGYRWREEEKKGETRCRRERVIERGERDQGSR